METRGFGVHETLELHEILTFKNICCTKSSAMQLLISDEDLKSILQQDVSMSKRHIQELQGLLIQTKLQ